MNVYLVTYERGRTIRFNGYSFRYSSAGDNFIFDCTWGKYSVSAEAPVHGRLESIRVVEVIVYV